MNQAMSTDKKRAASLTSSEFYLASIKEARGVTHLLSEAELATDIKHASDWSYSASSYASPHLRIVGDAGAFIDPYFSSGVHLALSGALSAAVTISAAIRGDTDEQTAWKWHTNGVTERYTRFLLVVLGATKQIRHRDAPVLNESNEDGFDRAFSIIRPGIPPCSILLLPLTLLTQSLVIQGTADVRDAMIPQADISKAVDFTYNAVQGNTPEKPTSTNGTATDAETNKWQDVGEEAFSTDEARVLKMVKATFADYFTVDAFDGMVANLERGKLGLVKAGGRTQPSLEEDEIDEKKPLVVEMTPMPAPIAAGV